ncbi:response regulator transcription factor [Myroides marinus]|uniref:response regulator transcription factor n=1 Tax=Myroides marinus TaxID=703342 RepID=UPI002574B68F|nr:response regulator transcription factor [Myroides marinus]MDM1381916.1 response regulator transcription factor [Myroides marinus]MDM1391136.1 response regulator transcription factor [Myroides marinus]
MAIKIGIVDDHKLFLKSFSFLLSQVEGIEVVFKSTNGIELFESLKTKKVDILFLDIQMPVMDGFQIAHRLNEKYPELNVLILSSFNDSYSIERMLKYNISGYLTKNIELAQLEKAIHSVFNGGVYYDKQIRELVKYLQTQQQTKDVTITDKEVEIIRLFANQYSGREIAKKLNVSIRTIEKHKEILMQKTGASNFIGVIIFAITRHYITEDDLC